MAGQWDEFEQYFQRAHMGGSDLSSSCRSLPPTAEAEESLYKGELAGTHRSSQTSNSLRPATDTTRRRHSFHRSGGGGEEAAVALLKQNGEPHYHNHHHHGSGTVKQSSSDRQQPHDQQSKQEVETRQPRPSHSHHQHKQHPSPPDPQQKYLLGYEDSEDDEEEVDELLHSGVKHSRLTRMVSSPGMGSPRLSEEEYLLRSQSMRQKRTGRGDSNGGQVNEKEGTASGEDLMNSDSRSDLGSEKRLDIRLNIGLEGRGEVRANARVEGAKTHHVHYSPQTARRVGSEKFKEHKSAPPRHYSMPVKRRGYSKHAQLQPPDLQCPGEEDEDEDQEDAMAGIEVLRVRSFSTKSGGIVNRGDSFKVKSRSARMSSGRRKSSMRYSPTEGSPLAAAVGACGSYNRSLQQLGVTSEGGEVPVNCEVHVQLAEDGPGGVQHVTTQLHYPQLALPSPSNPLSQSASAYSLHQDRLVAGGSVSPREARHSFSEVVMTSDMMNNMAATVAVAQQDGTCLSAEGVHGEEVDEDEESVLRVLVLGTQGVGKTTLTSQLLTSEYLANSDNLPDLEEWGDQILSVMLDDEETMARFIEISEEEDERLHGHYDACIIVYSVTERKSFRYAQACLQGIRNEKPGCHVAILVANKNDLVRNREVYEEEGKRLALRHKCKHTEVSALLDHKLDELLVGIIRQVRLAQKRMRQKERRQALGCIQKTVWNLFHRLFRRSSNKHSDSLLQP